jgi:peptidoglycan/LPS O-acetylase OafA/YrhL
MRGLACILLVFYHVVGSDSQEGLQLAGDHPLRIFNFLLQDVRMPMFSFVSGFVFDAVSGTKSELWNNIYKKIRRLMFPYLSTSLVIWFLKEAINQNYLELYQIFYIPYVHLWYLPATLILMTAHLIATYVLKIGQVRTAAILMIATTALYVLMHDAAPTLFAIDGALYLGPYFFTGYIVSHAGRHSATRPHAQGLAAFAVPVLFVALVALHYPIKTGIDAAEDEAVRLLRVLFGLTVCGCFLMWRRDIPALTRLGAHSYPIFLYHIVFTSATRMALHRLAPGMSEFVIIWPCLMLGLLGPLACEWLLLKTPLTALVFLGIARKSPPDEPVPDDDRVAPARSMSG